MDSAPQVSYWGSDRKTLKAEIWQTPDGTIHRDGDKPAWTKYDHFGNIEEETWYIDGCAHRDGDRPASQIYARDGTISGIVYYKHGNMHRLVGPAFILYGENKKPSSIVWYNEGMVWARDERPCYVIYGDNDHPSYEQYHDSHRVNGPVEVYRDAVTGEILKEIWKLNGVEFDIDKLNAYIKLSESDKVLIKLMS